MTWLKTVPKTATFTKYMPPDAAVPTIESAGEVPNELQRKARIVKGAFTWVKPEARDAFTLRWASPAACETLGIPQSETNDALFAETLAGQNVFTEEDLHPWAQNYAGYQFGNWAGQLGDGRAISLFEVTAPKSQTRYEVQLKGAGLTPYSRFADGLAVLRSSIREALASESVHALGIPTTRALALVELPETKARRERTETCAIVTRFAPSWVRIGTFDLYHSRDDRENVRRLADYCIEHVFENKLPEPLSEEENRYYRLFKEVTLRNCKMVAKCQAYGFLNGVLNTDNTSIVGVSMDYGPFAFMDIFDFAYTPNHDDGALRYGYRNSPTMIWWNCVRLGEALGELIGASDVDNPEFIANGTQKEDRRAVSDRATKLIMDLGDEFQSVYRNEFSALLAKRLGLLTTEESDYDELLFPLLKMMEECELEYNPFFRKLGDVPFFSGESCDATIFLPKDRGYAPRLKKAEAAKAIDDWMIHYAARLEKERNIDDSARKLRMHQVNPNFVLKNWILNDVIAHAQRGDWEPFNAVAKMALSPFESEWDVGYEEYLDETPKEARGILCSCSS